MPAKPLQIAAPPNRDAFIGSEHIDAASTYATAIQSIEPIQHVRAGFGDQYRNIDSNVSVRSGFSRLDYDFFRPAEQVPRFQKQVISACMAAYDKIGIIRNVIDTMADFASQGVRWTHEDPEVEQFYNVWWKKVGGPDRTERFLNLLYRGGNVVIKRSRAKLKRSEVQEFQRLVADEHIDYVPDLADVQPLEIPLRYSFIHPLTLDVVGDELASLTGTFFYTINLSPKLIKLIRNPKDSFEQEMVASLPRDITEPVRQGRTKIKISDDDLITSYYKKDDWQVWANPMTYAILDDLIHLEKMKLADLAALDGAISHIRIWKLGSLEHKMLPTDAAIQKLSDLLLHNVGGGSMDLIWGPDLELDETSTEIHRFLGSAKYETCLMNIYAGLGVPPTMTGASAGGGGFNQNFISLKTLTERLRYGRQKADEFWDRENRMVQKAMGFKKPATLLYDHMNLSDEVAEKSLWIQLVDRNKMSEQTLQERFGAIPDVERRRILNEWKRRENGEAPPMAGPFHDAQPEDSMKKIFAQRGAVTPGEVGLDLLERAPGEKTMLEVQQEMQEQKVKGQPGQGRPLNKKDSKKRKTRPAGVSKAGEEFVELSLWARSAQDAISSMTADYFSANAFDEVTVEQTRSAILQRLAPRSEVTEESVGAALASIQETGDLLYIPVAELLKQFQTEFKARKGGDVTPDELRQLNCCVYALYNGTFDPEGDDDGQDHDSA